MDKPIVVAFDIYGTILSPGSIAKNLEQYTRDDKDRARSIATLWRHYQLEYTWRLNSMGRYMSFEEVTRNALIHALQETGISVKDDDIRDLLIAHDNMAAFPDVEPALDQLARAENIAPVIFTNGTSDMVSKSVLRSGPLSRYTETFTDLVTVDEVRKFKPAPEVYNYLAERVGKDPSDIWVISSNPFDIIGALHVGMKVIWIDRSRQGWADLVSPGLEPTAIVDSLEKILDVVNDREGAAIVAALFEAFFVDETLVDIFDAVLVNEGYGDLVTTSRVLYPQGDDVVKRLGKPTQSAVYAPFSLRQIVEFVVLLPLNFIPVAGTPMFLILTGYRAGPFHHWRYFQLLDLSKQQRKERIRRRQLQYTTFGTVALILQLVPPLSMFFLMSTAVGSALWAVDLENKRDQIGGQRPDLVSDYHDEDTI
ncbi:hypothetical protein BBP40_003754 [Aspergillus hancockii]|nr:hypothetical protein BBP40_003754 [Aspergillus hancockii]